MKRCFVIVLLGLVLCTMDDTSADHGSTSRTLAEYRYFRTLSIDLVGRPPTRDEIAAYEHPDFNLDAWLDAHLTGPQYAERIRRIYMDLLRLELPPAVIFKPSAVMIQWTTILGPSGKPISLYFRPIQRRVKPEIDGQVCFSEDEIGVKIPDGKGPMGTPKPISQALLDARTVVVKPWWLYGDYRSANPQDRATPEWAQQIGYELLLSMFVEPDKITPMTGVRVCKEEAQTAATGHVYVTRRVVRKGDPLLPGRLTKLPMDTPFATANAGGMVSCLSITGVQSSVECGCGVGLERCLPSAPGGFVTPIKATLGVEQPFYKAPVTAPQWMRAWLSEEATHFIDEIFAGDRDVRELLTSTATTINGPLAQFYRYFANATCCGPATELGYTSVEPLFDPAAVPKSLNVHDVSKWVTAPDRGPFAAGIMTMPVFLLKYGSRRQRAHAIYSVFMCKDFVAENVKLAPSTEVDLTKRPGCSSCHERLEPMAAYFSRVQESDWTYLPPAELPTSSERCAVPAGKRMSGTCKTYYDPEFTDSQTAMLRGAYAAPDHANSGPAGFATEVTSSPEFAPCVVKNVAQSMLGRSLTPEDDQWKASLAQAFITNGYRMRSLVRAIVTSPRYREVNDQMPVAR